LPALTKNSYKIKSLILGLLKETINENGVALLPETVDAFVKLKVTVMVVKGAVEKASLIH
jgi:hypothetical protein